MSAELPEGHLERSQESGTEVVQLTYAYGCLFACVGTGIYLQPQAQDRQTRACWLSASAAASALRSRSAATAASFAACLSKHEASKPGMTKSSSSCCGVVTPLMFPVYNEC